MSRVADCVLQTRKLPICSKPEGAQESFSEESEIVQVAALIGCEPAAFATFGSAIDAVMSYLARNRVQDYFFTFFVDSVGGSPLTAGIIVSHATADGLRMLEFRSGGTVARYITDALRVKRYVSGSVLSHIASEIGFVTIRAAPIASATLKQLASSFQEQELANRKSNLPKRLVSD